MFVELRSASADAQAWCCCCAVHTYALSLTVCSCCSHCITRRRVRPIHSHPCRSRELPDRWTLVAHVVRPIWLCYYGINCDTSSAPCTGVARNLLGGTNQGSRGRKSPAGSRGKIWKPYREHQPGRDKNWPTAKGGSGDMHPCPPLATSMAAWPWCAHRSVFWPTITLHAATPRIEGNGKTSFCRILISWPTQHLSSVVDLAFAT